MDVAAEVKKLTRARQGADVVLEMTGSPQVYPMMFEILRNEGSIVTVGHPGEVPINVTQWINLKGASLKGVFGRRTWQTWWKLASLVESGKLDLSGILTHRFELNESEEAFAQIKSGAGKVLFIPTA